MKTILRIIGSILSYDDVQAVTIKKVEDSKVEIFDGEKYVGRYSVNREGKDIIDELLKEASLTNRLIHDITICLFRPYGSDRVEMVIERESWGGLRTICPSSFGGFSETHISEDKGIYKTFGEGRTLTDILKDPFEFDAFYKSFYK
jgi:hypothetical protein